MLVFFAKRAVSALLCLVLVSCLTFSIAHLAGDPAVAMAGREASAEEIAKIRHFYGFDRPLVVQYLEWAGRAATGDFGRSLHYQQSVADMLAARLPITLTLGIGAILVALALSLPLGVAAGTSPGSPLDRLAMAVSAIGQAVPTFWLALLLIVLFGVRLRWLPVSGNATWQHFLLPTATLAFFAMPPLIRLARAGMIEALDADYIRTARAKGLRARQVVLKHAVRNMLIPIVSVAAVQLGGLLGGSIVIEQIFALQGIGWLGYDATTRSDLPVVQAITLLVATVYIVLTLVADLLNAALDPRIRLRR
jgi:ABC-type dipeptide/oligopeptide/nickel transport system permease component